MKKYILIARNMWTEMTMYRLNFVMWRIRTVFQLVTIYFLWHSLIPANASLFGYSQTQMLTYILGTSLMFSITLASRSGDVGGEINSGDLSNYLVRPINYFFYWAAKDVADKVMNITFSVIELTFLFVLLQPPLFIQTNILLLFFTFFAILCAACINFFFNLLLGSLGFWTPEIWAPRFIFYILTTFFAGSLFPLDILPENIFTIFSYLPFTYMLYFPLKVYLGQLAYPVIFQGLLICLFWTIAMYFITTFVWNKGLKTYTAQGR